MAKISDLKFDDKNFNKHTEYGMGLLEKSLRELGAGRSILLDKDNNIIAGNGIVEAAGSVGLENVKIVETTGDEIVAVKRTDMTIGSKEGREMALADNATANADLSWDEDNIKEQTEKWDFDTSDWGGDFNFDKDIEVEEDETPEVNESEPAKSELGKVYHLGKHRLMCGDSTDAGSVAILMDGQKADMVFTDPPYGVDYDGINNDNRNGLESLLDKAFICMQQFSKEGASVYCFHSDRCSDIFNNIFRKFCHFSSMIIWKKQSLVLSQTDYQSIHEPCMYGWFKNGTHKWYGDRKQVSVWEFGRENVSGHTTPKPIAMVCNAIANSSLREENVLDLFGGSGSTLIACEQLGRKCYMMELDPKYCDVIRKRYWKFKTGSEEGWEDGTRAN